jgi:hypothetical protein
LRRYPLATLHLRLALLLAALSLLLIASAHLAPAERLAAAELESLFFASSSCPTACLMGIQPEATTLQEALALLNAHAWVRDVHDGVGRAPQRTLTVTWAWNGSQPDLIRGDIPGMLLAQWYSGINTFIVSGVSIETRLRFPDVLAALELEGSGYVLHWQRAHEITYLVDYYAGGLRTTLSARIACPAGLMRYWHTGTRFSQGGQMSDMREPLRLAPWQLGRACG